MLLGVIASLWGAEVNRAALARTMHTTSISAVEMEGEGVPCVHVVHVSSAWWLMRNRTGEPVWDQARFLLPLKSTCLLCPATAQHLARWLDALVLAGA